MQSFICFGFIRVRWYCFTHNRHYWVTHWLKQWRPSAAITNHCGTPGDAAVLCKQGLYVMGTFYESQLQALYLNRHNFVGIYFTEVHEPPMSRDNSASMAHFQTPDNINSGFTTPICTLGREWMFTLCDWEFQLSSRIHFLNGNNSSWLKLKDKDVALNLPEWLNAKTQLCELTFGSLALHYLLDQKPHSLRALQCMRCHTWWKWAILLCLQSLFQPLLFWKVCQCLILHCTKCVGER